MEEFVPSWIETEADEDFFVKAEAHGAGAFAKASKRHVLVFLDEKKAPALIGGKNLSYCYVCETFYRIAKANTNTNCPKIYYGINYRIIFACLLRERYYNEQ